MATINIQIYPDPINQLNFLRWHLPTGGSINSGEFIANGECLQVFQPDNRPASPCKVIATADDEQYALPMVYGDVVSFVINADKDFGVVADLSLHLLKGIALTVIPSPTLAYITENSKKYLTGTFTVPCVADGRYNLVLAKNVSNVANIVAVSNPVRIMNYQSSQHPTVLADFRHTVSQFGCPYTTGVTFRNRFRLDALLTVPKPIESITTYEDRNRVTRFIGQGKLERVTDFRTDHLDARTHEAIAAMFLHNDVKLNGASVLKLDSYETDPENDTYNLYQGSTRLKDLTFTALQNNC